MAKLTYLQLVNRVLKRITQTELASSVSTATGTTKIIAEMINEAQNELWTETTNWYTLFKMRTFSLAPYTASTIAFNENGASPDTITDSGTGLTNQSGQTIVVSGSTLNDGVYITTTATSAALTLQTADDLVAEGAGSPITIYPITYPLATDWGRAYHLVDVTNNRILTEDTTRSFSEADPDMTSTGSPTHFSIQGNFYRFYYPVSSTVKIVERYWSFPTPLSGDSDTYDLPLFCENFIINWALMSVLDYLNKFEQADRVRLKLYGNATSKNESMLYKCKQANKKIIDQMLRFELNDGGGGLQPPKFPSHY